MLRFLTNEVFKEFALGYPSPLRYAVSNMGRVISFQESFFDGRILKMNLYKGYIILRKQYMVKGKRVNKNYFVHRLVADNFLSGKCDEKPFVIHKDYNKSNNQLGNLQWATKSELTAHHKLNPAVISAQARNAKIRVFNPAYKLTENRVRLIKKKIFDPNRKTRMKMIAKQFGISEMQLYRIKSGENWGHIRIEEQPPA